MTRELFREDGYLRTCDTTITEKSDLGFACAESVFYPQGGGQPGDSGIAEFADGRKLPITNTLKDRESGLHLHCVDPELLAALSVGDTVTLSLNWDRRHKHMRMHSCLHMLCAAVPAPVTGGSIQEARGRLDFDLPETIDKEALSEKLNELISGNHAMQVQWITDDELDANPELVRTLSVQPPRGGGKIRLVNFEGVDLQPCGGTHVANTSEIGPVRVQKIEKKGKINRRIIVVFDEK